MVSIEEFYELPREEQQRLVSERRVIVDQQPVSELPEDRVPIRVLEKPLTSEIFERLQQGRYTVSELADEIGIRNKDVRTILNRYRHQNFGELLKQYHAVLRAKDNQGPSLVFSLESIPYFARIADPTLMCSLLEIREPLSNRFESTEWIQEGSSVEMDKEYAYGIADFWRFPTDDVVDYMRGFERQYIYTDLGVLAIVKDGQQYEKIKDRLSESESAYARRKGIDEATTRTKLDPFRERRSNSPEDIEFYQSLSLTLFDLLEYARHEDPPLQGSIEGQIEEVIGWLDSDSAKQDSVERQVANENSNESEGVKRADHGKLDWDERELLIELVALTQEIGKLPTETEINYHTSFSHRTYVEKFGSLMNACHRAGIIDESGGGQEEDVNTDE